MDESGLLIGKAQHQHQQLKMVGEWHNDQVQGRENALRLANAKVASRYAIRCGPLVRSKTMGHYWMINYEYRQIH